MAEQEKLIINGVDVAGCRFPELLYGTVCCNKSGLRGACNNNPECEYKQLKRLEQERDDLQERKDKYYQQTLDDAITISDLVTECNELKQENKEIYENGQIEITKLCNEKTKYRSALEEINILVKNYCNACDEFKVKTYKNKNDCLYCNYGFIKRKINEVLQ